MGVITRAYGVCDGHQMKKLSVRAFRNSKMPYKYFLSNCFFNCIASAQYSRKFLCVFFYKCIIAMLPEKIGKKTQIKFFYYSSAPLFGGYVLRQPHSKCLKLDSTEPIDTVCVFFFIYIHIYMYMIKFIL